jgi:hypothetical protein
MIYSIVLVICRGRLVIFVVCSGFNWSGCDDVDDYL